MPLARVMRNLWHLLRPSREIEALLPDFVEQRGDSFLLVWRDVPHWMVVDREAHDLLTSASAQELLSNPGLRHALPTLLGCGVIRRRNAAPAQPPREEIESVAIHVTRQCNLHCRYCYHDHPARLPELEARSFLAALHRIGDLTSSQASLLLLGGEPLLATDIVISLADAARQRGMQPIVSTNGTLVTESFASAAASIGLHVQVSLDGHTAELNDGTRGRGTFDRAVRGIRSLVDAGAHTIVSMVAHAGAVDHIEAFYAFAHELGANEARHIPAKRLGRAARGTIGFVPVDELVRTGMRVARDPHLKPLMGRDCFSILARTCRYSAKQPSCGTGRRTVLLDADGTLYPCLNLCHPDWAFGNVSGPGFDLREGWMTSPVLGEVRKRTAIDAIEGCASCAVKHWCLGGCRGESYAAFGDLGRKPTDCDHLRRAIVDTLFAMADGAGVPDGQDVRC